MFNLFKKSKQVFQNYPMKKVKNTNEIIAEIHNEFDTSTEKLLNDAKAILAGDYNIEKGERLKKVGFVSAKKAVEANTIIASKEENEKLANLINYYQLHYPNNKFITEDKVKSICQKYGLLFAETKYYISDVPEKNLLEIESFKLRQEDMTEYKCLWYKWERGNFFGYYHGHIKKIDKSAWGYVKKIDIRGGEVFINQPEDTLAYYEPDPLKICASVKDFDTKNMRIEDGYKLEINLPDPVVLQPVEGGYLIVTKWGLEGEDESLVNEKMN